MLGFLKKVFSVLGMNMRDATLNKIPTFSGILEWQRLVYQNVSIRNKVAWLAY